MAGVLLRVKRFVNRKIQIMCGRPLFWDHLKRIAVVQYGILLAADDNIDVRSLWFFNMIQTMSFDSMVRFFDGFVREARKERDEYYREKRAKMQRGREEGARRRAAKQNQELQN
ncbi:uncharacterized protein PgNI_12578 [Pyricularia grisea]|uniref:Uncharacterized protein n=1 Tax=Pyricularia grisea TaxID=148305 RepID=A0A6P8AM33_PYRGI|nr:uncharacterized protein PgNI_12578 [Pyricularia grisea]TLD03094.1 hypothetical protein PgNI_12578 [Pyricularia grisea]